MASAPALKRSDTIAESMPDALRQNRYHMKRCFASFVAEGKRLMKRNELKDKLEKTIEDEHERSQIWEGLFGYVLTCTQEAAVVPPYVTFAVRPNPGYWEFVKVNSEDLTVEETNVSEYLKFKERIFDESWGNDENALEIDFGAIDFSTPHLTLPSSIGNDVKFYATKLIGYNMLVLKFL